MSQPETPSPERKSNNAILCFCIGAGLLFLAWLLGLGGALTALLSGSLAGVAMGLAAGVVLILAAASGAVLMAVGVVWMIVRVIADQAEADRKERYSKEVER